MTNKIDMEKLKSYVNAYILYEISTHGTDPRGSLPGTLFRTANNEAEGYKYKVYADFQEKKKNVKSYTDLILNTLPGINLTSYHQKNRISNLIKDNGDDQLEEALRELYEGTDDEIAFHHIVDIIGGHFDVLGFLFFLKDNELYMPIRSNLFDERFKVLGLNSSLSGHCSWSKYQEYNDWLKQIQIVLCDLINKDITLLDAHSFVWIISGISQYLEQEIQVVEHKNLGKGTVYGFDGDTMLVHFGDETKKFNKELAFTKGTLSILPNDYDVYLNSESIIPEEIDSVKAESIIEGAKKKITVNAYERDLKATRQCKQYYLKKYGRITCQICGFDFGKVYGSEYDNMIHIHHIRPLSTIQQEYELDPLNDLIPVCPNCHMVLHAKGGTSLEKLKSRFIK